MSEVITKTISKQDYKTLSLAALGGALEFYDFIIFVFFAVVIGNLFFPVDIPQWLKLVQAYGIFAAGYLARPFGGIIMAHFGDLFGRKKMFALSILMMAIPTLCIGLLPTYTTVGLVAPLLLLLMRICQGIAVGGEVPGAWVFVSEHVPAHRVGFACGVLTAGLTAGILLGSLVSTLLNSLLSIEEIRDYGWRIPFILGGVFGLFAMYLRRWLQETPVFNAIQKRKKLANEIPIKSVLARYKKSVIVAMLLTWVLSAGIMVVILLSPNYLQMTFGLSAVATLKGNSLAIVALSIGCVFYGAMIDKFGASKTLITGSIIAIFTTWLFYYSASSSSEYVFITYSLAGFGVGIVGSFAYVMVRAFPAIVKFSGVSFSFNMAYAIAGGLTPVMIVTLTELTSKMAPAYYVMLLFALGCAIGFYLRKDLKADEFEGLES